MLRLTSGLGRHPFKVELVRVSWVRIPYAVLYGDHYNDQSRGHEKHL